MSKRWRRSWRRWWLPLARSPPAPSSPSSSSSLPLSSPSFPSFPSCSELGASSCLPEFIYWNIFVISTETWTLLFFFHFGGEKTWTQVCSPKIFLQIAGHTCISSSRLIWKLLMFFNHFIHFFFQGLPEPIHISVTSKNENQPSFGSIHYPT